MRQMVALAATLLLAFAVLPSKAIDIGGGIVNTPPVVTTVSLSTGSSVTPSAGGTASITVTTTITDANGYNDVTGVTVGILKPDGSTVHVAQAAGSFSSGTALVATWTKTVTMNFYDAAATGGSTYKVKVVATDAAGATGDNVAALTTFNYGQLAAMTAPASLSLGAALSSGATSSVGSLSIQNYGNVQIDTQVSGTALTLANPSATIPVGSLSYSLSSDMSGSTALTGSAASLSAFDLGAGSSSAKTLYWRLTVPDASTQYLPAGTYTSTVTVTAVAG